MKNPKPALLTAWNVGNAFGVTAKTVRAWVRAGKIEAVTTPSGRYLFHPDCLPHTEESERLSPKRTFEPHQRESMPCRAKSDVE